jgi:hypothetical protein
VNIHRTGARIAEAPVKIRSQRLAQRIRFHDVRTIFIDTLAVFYRARILHWYDRAPEALRTVTAIEPVVSRGGAVPREAAVAVAAGSATAV